MRIASGKGLTGKTQNTHTVQGMGIFVLGCRCHQEPEYMSADYFFIGLGSNNLTSKAFR